MAHAWFNWMKSALTQIETIYPHSPAEVKRELADRFHHLQDASDEWLDEWLLLQEQFQSIVSRHPELAMSRAPDGLFSVDSAEGLPSEEPPKNAAEFWMDEHALHQFREGQGYYELFMFPRAMEQFAHVVNAEPDFLLGRLYLALTHYHNGQLEKAEKQFKTVLRNAPNDEFRRFSHHMLGCLSVKRQQDVDALRHFSRALTIDSGDADTLFNLGACHFRLHSVRMAIPCFEQALQQNRDDWESLSYLASCYAALGDYEQAAFWRKRAYDVSQKPEIILAIANDYERENQPDNALKWNLYCVAKHPNWAEGYHGVAWSKWKRDRDPQAIVWLKKALTLKRNDENMLFSYWWMIQSAGTAHEQDRVKARLSAIMHASPLWKLVHGNRHRIKGNVTQAEQALLPLLENSDARMRGAAHYELAHLQMAEQNWPGAVKHFHEARRCDEQLKDTWLFEGICHYLHGEKELSKKCLKLYQSQGAL